jgi:WD40 repeat protein
VFSEDGKRLYAGAHGGLLMEIDVATGQETNRFVGHSGAVLGIALSPDGSQIVSGDNSSGQVVIWDVGKGQQIVTLATDGAPVTSLDWSSDGYRIVAGKSDGSVQIWTLPWSP